jgi:glutathione S-transferase
MVVMYPQRRRLFDINTLLIRPIIYISAIVACNACWTVHSMASSSSAAPGNGNDSKARFITNKMCPFAQKVWIALEESQIPYELQEISLYGANGKPAWFRKLNPAGTVPVLVYTSSPTNKDVVVPDSDLILDHIQQGLIEGTRNALCRSDRDDLLIKSWRKRINDMLPVGKRAVLSAAAPSQFGPLLQDMDQAIVGPYLTGTQVTVADCHAFPFLWRLSQEKDILCMDGYKHLQAWLTLCSKRPSFQRTIQLAWWWWW